MDRLSRSAGWRAGRGQLSAGQSVGDGRQGRVGADAGRCHHRTHARPLAMGRRKQVVPKKTDEGQGTPATQDEGEAYFHWFTCVPPKPQELEDIVKLLFSLFMLGNVGKYLVQLSVRQI